MQNIQDEELFKKYALTKENSLKNQLALSNQKLVSYVIGRYYGKKRKHVELREDLFQEGRIGLLTAIEKFDPYYGTQFSTYAIHWIHQAIRSFLMEQSSILSVPANVLAAQHKIFIRNKKGLPALENEDEYSPKMLKNIEKCIRARHTYSLDTNPMVFPGEKKNKWEINENSSFFASSVADKKSDENLLRDQEKIIEIVGEILKTLPIREKNILLLRYNIINTPQKKRGRKNKKENKNKGKTQ